MSGHIGRLIGHPTNDRDIVSAPNAFRAGFASGPSLDGIRAGTTDERTNVAGRASGRTFSLHGVDQPTPAVRLSRSEVDVGQLVAQRAHRRDSCAPARLDWEKVRSEY